MHVSCSTGKSTLFTYMFLSGTPEVRHAADSKTLEETLYVYVFIFFVPLVKDSSQTLGHKVGHLPPTYSGPFLAFLHA